MKQVQGLGLGLMAAIVIGCTPSLPNLPACNTPPAPDQCCDIVWGSVHGTVTDPGGQPVPGAQVTLRTQAGVPLGNCAPSMSVLTNDQGYYQFDVVPFDVPVEVNAVPPGRPEGQRKTVTVPRGPLVLVDFAF